MEKKKYANKGYLCFLPNMKIFNVSNFLFQDGEHLPITGSSPLSSLPSILLLAAISMLNLLLHPLLKAGSDRVL